MDPLGDTPSPNSDPGHVNLCSSEPNHSAARTMYTASRVGTSAPEGLHELSYDIENLRLEVGYLSQDLEGLRLSDA